MTTPQDIETPVDEVGPAVSDEELAASSPEVLANTFGEYMSAWWRRIKSGESGAIPVLIGLLVIVIFFQLERGSFLSDGNLVNLFEEACIYIVLGVAETFILLLSEIDLSLGYGMGVGGFVIAELAANPVGFPWWLAVIGGIVVMGGFGLLQGMLVTGLGLPSFIVTLGGQLGLLGIMIELSDIDKTAVGGVIQIDPSSPIYKLVNTNMSPTLGWIVLAVCAVGFAGVTLNRNRSRRKRGLHAQPIGVAVMTVVGVVILGALVEYICNSNRSAIGVLEGMPWVLPFVLLIVMAYSWLLGRTRTGRYIYAVGASPEGARRAGIKVKWIIVFCFIMSSATAALAAIIYISQQGSMSIDIDGGTEVMYAVAASVIGGTALFGGRGRIVNALLGGVVIAVVFNGLALMGVNAAIQDIATAVVLIAAVSLDAIVRKRTATATR